MPNPFSRGNFNKLHLLWIVPAGAAVLAGFFIGIGLLTAWLWQVTITDIFEVKPISFWQAWGLILLAQLLFKANITGHRQHGRKAGKAKDAPLPGPAA